ncbi:MAG: class I SAM-dependent RNA methyltransferase [Paracoccaceae bacterium]|nr:class I SAM-dependent RNA methyltransferase [Paracoccaceae bacterium]
MDVFKITRLGHQADGIAAGPVFVPRTLPGEVITGRLDGQAVRDVRIVTPSDHRVAAPCVHFKTCGGCQLQHASDTFVADFKTEVVRIALSAKGLSTVLRPIETSPSKSRRRAVFSARRTKKAALSGFHAHASNVIVAVPECQLLHPDLTSALPMVEALAVTGSSRKGAISATVTHSEAGLDISVTGGKPLDQVLRSELGELAKKFHLARLSWADEVIALRAPPFQSFGAAQVVPPSGAFLQATAHGEQALVLAVLGSVGGAKQLVDLFCGCGTFSLPLAQNGEVHAVESVGAMLTALDHGWRQASGLKIVTHVVRDLFRGPLLPDELEQFDAIVLDPPRAGAEAQVVEIAKTNVPRISYVSCNPVSFARDAAVLAMAGYTLDWVQVVDQFRWSSHVELASQFSKSK